MPNLLAFKGLLPVLIRRKISNLSSKVRFRSITWL